MGAPGFSYPPLLQEAVDHADRIAALITKLDVRSARRTATTWLVGRSEEVACFVADVTGSWRSGELTVAEAGRAINAYVQSLHRGLAMNFGELAPSCCVSSLVITADPVSFLEVTASFPPSLRARWAEVSSTWGEVDEGEILESSSLPRPR